jgi:outer membrane protein assembly factor BamD
MFKRLISIVGITVVLVALSACHNKKVVNPIADVNSKQPDKILFDRAMDAMKHNRFDVARLTLQTMINTYPDSEYVARAKLAVGDSWYAEGGSAAMTQAENEYKDFITFFPNMPEAAEAQLKIANIHYREMEKPDRDFTHAMRAEEEYRNLIKQFPDSKLVPEAKQRLLEVQEVLAEREFRIGRFYFLRESNNAAVARLKTLTDTYPLYSKADLAYFLLGNAYLKQGETMHAVPVSKQFPEAAKGKLIKEREDLAAGAFSHIVTRYPISESVPAAKKALEAMHRPIPTPTPEAIAQNKAEEASRGEAGMIHGMMLNLHKGPDLAAATKHGEPTLDDPAPTNAPELVKEFNEHMAEAVRTAYGVGGGDNKVGVEIHNSGPPPANDPVPRSDSGTQEPPAANDAIPELKPITDPNEQQNSNVTAAPPTQLNEVQQPAATDQGSGTSSSSSVQGTSGTTGSTDAAQTPSTTNQKPDEYSTSKPKKKKGLHKIIPF